jgi:putative intracellular protease/amidase
MPSLRVLMPLPDSDFDTTESALTWAALVDAGYQVDFATETGAVAACDRFLVGKGWRYTFPASEEAVTAYRRMEGDPRFQNPISYQDIDATEYVGVHFSGGHSPGMKQYLESGVLHQQVPLFLAAGKTIGAICHGVLVLARAVDSTTGRSVLDGREVTTLTKQIERMALRKTWYRVGRRYRTYRTYTEDEVRKAVGVSGFVDRGDSLDIPLVVVDGQFVTARYPADVPEYAAALIKHIGQQ